MSDARRTVNIAFDGNTNGLRRASADANGILEGVGKTAGSVTGRLAGMLRQFLIFGPIIVIIAEAAKAAAGFLLLIPAAILALAATIGVGILAVNGFGEAVAAASPLEFVTATRSMAPSMREAVVSVRRLRPEFYALRRLVQEGFWSGFAADLNTLTSKWLPTLKTRLPEVASGLAAIRAGIFAALSDPRTVVALDNALRLIAEMLVKMRGSLGSFLAGFIKLANIGSAFLPRFGEWLAEIAAWFEAWVDAGAASGSIAAFIEDALQSFRDLLDIAVNLGFAVKAIVDAITGGDGISALVNFSAAVRAFFEGEFAQSLIKALTQVLSLLYNIISVIVNALALVGGGGSSTGGGGFLAGVGNFFSGLFGRAGGGPVMAGQSYIVGEQGREILTMGSAGFITPSSGTSTGEGGPGGVVVNVYIGETELRQIVETEVSRMVRDTARSVYSGLGVAG